MLFNRLTPFLPEGNLKHRLQDIQHIEQLPIAEAGVTSEAIPFIRLQDGLIFYGHPPNKRQKIIYHLLTSSSFRKRVPEQSYNVAWDIWLRYWQDGHMNQQRHYQLKEGDVVIEAGAYVGYYTLKMSQAVGPTGHIIAIEPVEENRTIILKNVAANQIQNVTVLPYAVWKTKGKTTFYLTDRQKNSLLPNIIRKKGSVHGIPITTNTIDNIIDETGVQSPNLVIITVNGAEIEALQGMTKTLKNLNVHLAIAGKYVVDGEPIYKKAVQILEDAGYKVILDHYGFTKNEAPEQQAVIYASR